MKLEAKLLASRGFDIPTPKEPLQNRLVLNFVFAPHITAKDAEVLKPKLQTCDIFIPEICSWTSNSLDLLRQVSNATIPLEIAQKRVRANFPLHRKKVHELLYKSGKAIALIDLPAGHPLDEESDEIESFEHNPENDPFVKNDFTEALNGLKEIGIRKAKWLRKREDYMIDQFPIQVKALLEQNLRLAKKSPLNILIFLGSDHTYVAHALVKAGYKVAPIDFPKHKHAYSDEVLRRLTFGKEVDDLLLAKVLITTLFNNSKKFYVDSAISVTDDETKILDLARVLFDRFSMFELEQLWKTYQESQKIGFVHALEAELTRKRLKLPETGDELEAMINPQTGTKSK